MKTTRKTIKTITVFAVICFLFISVCFTIGFNRFGSPQAEAESDPIFTFACTSDTECSVRLKDKTVTRAIVPETVVIDDREYTVTSVTINGFANASALEKVRLPKTIKSIGQMAFTNCKSLNSITIPAV